MIKEKIKGGATIWARQTVDSDIFFWKTDKWFKIWFFVVNEVNHKDTKNFKRGEGLLTYQQVSSKCKATSAQVKHCFEYLRKANMIATRRTTRGLVISIIKYDYFQNLKNYYYNESPTKSPTESQSLANHKPITSPTINKNDNNDKNDKNNVTEPSSVGNQVNEIIGMFKEVNPSYKQLYSRLPQRAAVERLLKEHGQPKLERMIEALPTIISKPYAPKVTTPYLLETKLGELIAFSKQNKQKSAWTII